MCFFVFVDLYPKQRCHPYAGGPGGWGSLRSALFVVREVRIGCNVLFVHFSDFCAAVVVGSPFSPGAYEEDRFLSRCVVVGDTWRPY